jgi:hypothetical protein
MTNLLRLGIAAVSVTAVAALSGCGSESDGVFDRDDFPFTFEYPDDFSEGDDVSIDESLGASATATAAVAIDDDDLILVQLFDLNTPIDESNLVLAKREIDQLLAQYTPNAETRKTTVAGLPALTADGIAVKSVPDAESRFTFIFDGAKEYELNCQATPEHRAEVDAACDQALSTLKLDSGG